MDTENTPYIPNWRDVAWRRIILKKPAAYLAFSYHEVIFSWLPFKEIRCCTDKVLSGIDFEGEKVSRVVDLLISIPQMCSNVDEILCCVLHRQTSDKDIACKVNQIFTRLSRLNPKSFVAVQLLRTGPKNVKYDDCYSEDKYGTKFTMTFPVCSIDDFQLEELKRDRRFFGIVMYIARLERDLTDNPKLRETYGREILEHLKNQKLYTDDMRYLCEFAFEILLLDADDISEELKEAYNEFIKTEENKVILLAMQHGESEGYNEGIKFGELQGNQATKPASLKEGYQEGGHDKYIAIAKTMLASNENVEKIANATFLPQEEILALGKG
jgi:hypothetical protein